MLYFFYSSFLCIPFDDSTQKINDMTEQAFGILNAFVYGTGAYFLFKEWRDVRHNGVVTPAS